MNGTENDIVTFELLSGATVLVKIGTLDLDRDVLTKLFGKQGINDIFLLESLMFYSKRC